jgi:hypothetical protein
MIRHAINDETLNKPIGKKPSRYSHIISALRDNLECGMLLLKYVAIEHNRGRHCVLVLDLSMDRELGALIGPVIERFTSLKEIEITVSRDDISEEERSHYAFIVVVQEEKVKAELP